MLAFPAMLVEAAKQAGMKVPKDPDKFDPEKFPHFQVFCGAQLGRPLAFWGEHWENAKVVAEVPEKKIRSITIPQLIGKGLKGVFG